MERDGSLPVHVIVVRPFDGPTLGTEPGYSESGVSMVLLTTLESLNGNRTSIYFERENLRILAPAGRVDSFIVSTEDGFSPLGENRVFLSADLGIPEKEIKHLADWNRFENPRVSLVALQSRRANSQLRGVILAASESSESYKRFAIPRYGRPYRDFYYNVSYEAIAFACSKWRAHRLALSHLSGSGTFHEDIATCNIEALAHYCDATQAAEIKSFTFVGCCISMKHLGGTGRLNAEASVGRHRPIEVEIESHEGYDIVHLAWNRHA